MNDYSLGPAHIGDHHYALLQHVLPSCTGTAVEFGTGNGTSTALIANYMPVVSFGSQFGLPEKWRDGYGPGSFAFPTPTIDNAEIVEGWFDETLPGYDFDTLGPVGLVHFDADLYSSTAIALEFIEPHLTPGTVVVFDEWHSFDGCEDHEQRAWREFADHTGTRWTVLGHGHEQWSIQIA